LTEVIARVSNFMREDEFVFVVNNALDVVTGDLFAVLGEAAGIGIGS